MREARQWRLRVSLRRRAADWWGPVALAAYLLAQLWFFPAFAWAGLVALAAMVALAFRRRLSPTQLMALQVLVAALIADYRSWGPPLRDFNLYVGAGARFLAHGTVYATEPLSRYPAGLDQLPFLYAPPTLPFFALLSMIPPGLASALWLAGSVAAVVASLRLFGLSWRWALAALIWTPIEQGLFVGNVVAPSLLLLALAPRLKAALTVGPLFKPQNGIVWLWLIRERAWRSVALGALALVAVVVATLPLTGLEAWRDWFAALVAYQRSEQLLPGLYGVGLGRYMPMWAFLVVAVVALAGALRAGGREGLARLGLASVVASPSLWTHGFVFAVPAYLRLRADVFWLVAGMTCQGVWPGPQATLGIAAAAWLFTGLTRQAADAKTNGGSGSDVLHPLGAAVEPWPSTAN